MGSLVQTMLTVLTPVRQLYTDDEEVLFALERIEDIIGRSDLADRAIFLTLAA